MTDLEIVEHLIGTDQEWAATPLNYVYFIIEDDGPFVKIGRTTDAYNRLSDIRCASPRNMRLLGVIGVPTVAARRLERWFHDSYIGYHVRGEWFELPEERIQAIHRDYGKRIPSWYGDHLCWRGLRRLARECLLSDVEKRALP